MEPLDGPDDVAATYRRFAGEAAESATFSDWAMSVAEDPEVLTWIADLPAPKRQPNLVFAAARWHNVAAPGPYRALREALLDDDGSIRRSILSRTTQTNETRRLACLTPAFALFDGPLALIEVGASAGLCLFPDRWGYQWRTPSGTVTIGDDPWLRCDVTGPAPLPREHPKVRFRKGIDLNPLDVRNPDEMAWLETLIWPEHEHRRQTLRASIALAQSDPPAIERGNLLDALPDLIDEARAFGTVVVFHSAVIAYLDAPSRATFDGLMRSLVARQACHWVSNEGRAVLPSITQTGPDAVANDAHRFVLGVDGAMVAHSHPHGNSLHWVAPAG